MGREWTTLPVGVWFVPAAGCVLLFGVLLATAERAPEFAWALLCLSVVPFSMALACTPIGVGLGVVRLARRVRGARRASR
jgi:hypothetical protein